ncbi:MAG: TolC family protein [Myxococcales bacterium]|nr:TolC family protein [Myxococcales bacterium]
MKGPRAALRWSVCALALSSVGALAQPTGERSTGDQPAGGQPTGERGAAPHDLASLLALAEARYPSLEARSAAITAARARLDEARLSPFFQTEIQAGTTIAPRAEGTPIFSNQNQLPVDNGWAPVVEVAVRGVVPLYTFGKLRNAWRAGRAGVRAAELDRDRALAQLRFDVRRAYFGLQLALDVQQMIREGRGHLERAVRTLDELLEDGDADVNPMDRYRLRTALAEIEARASQTTRLETSARAALRVLTGEREIQVPDCPSEPVRLPSDDVARATPDGRPEVGMLAAAIDAREAAFEAQRGAYAPDFGLGFQAGISYGPGVTNQQNPFIQDPANRPILGAGLFLRWNLDFVGNRHRVRRAEAELETTRAQAREARLGMELEIELAREAYRDAQEREASWGRGEREGRAWLVSAAQAYDVGAATPRDLVDALRAYFESRFSHLQAILDVNLAAAELERVTGVALEPTDGWERGCD